MSKLNQIIAIEKGIKSRVYAAVSELHKMCQKPALFNGLYRNYVKKDEEGEDLPPEKQHVQMRVNDVLATLRLGVSELIDVTVQKDEANMRATADVAVDGIIILEKVPVTSLLFLEKQLTDLRTFFEKLPILDISEAWSFDANSGLYRTEPVKTQRTKKVQKALVLYPATPEHPAQTQLVTEDVIAGFWTAVKQSGAMPRPTWLAMMERVEKLLIAVKEARERANDIAAGKRPAAGAAIFDYLYSARAE